ncbi:hypothetical protein PIB30_097296 [Stylosanthes scabra]|uniref:Uncharacterized protein n=1 Tax=Stylosanthes scabra TaxID=79078 RepID=A0ABU6YWV9_9FABA|nr:hypothetical protein [Stylosanthes scabra]
MKGSGMLIKAWLHIICGKVYWKALTRKLLRTSLDAQFLRNKAANKWLTSKEESSKIGKIRCNLNRSHKDLNYPQVYKQGASPPQGTHSLTLLTLFDLESHNPISGLLGLFTSTSTPFSAIVLWTIVKGPDLNIGTVCGDSYSRDKKCSAGDPSERWTMKYHSTMREQPTAVTRNQLRKKKLIRRTKPSSS